MVESGKKKLVFKRCPAFLLVSSTETTAEAASISVVRFAWKLHSGPMHVETGLALSLARAGRMEVGRLCLAEIGVVVSPKPASNYYLIEIVRVLDSVSSACLSQRILNDLRCIPKLEEIQISCKGAI